VIPPYPGTPTIPSVLRHAAKEWGDRDYIVMPDRHLSFAAAEASSRHLAKQLLAAGVGKGARIGIHVATNPDWVVAWLAVTRIGALAMPFSTLYRPAELRKAMAIGDVSLLIAAPAMFGKDELQFLEDAFGALPTMQRGRLRLREAPFLRSIWILGDTDRPWADHITVSAAEADATIDGIDDAILEAAEAEVTPGDPMVVVFTSGSSADPKAVIHTHGAVLRKTEPSSQGSIDLDFAGRMLNLMPFFWIGGLQMAAGALQGGGAVLTIERLEAASAIDLGRREGATTVIGNVAAMQSVLNGASLVDLVPTIQPPPPRVWGSAIGRHGDQSYPLGMTETVGPWGGVPGMTWKVIDPETGAELPDGELGEFCVRGYGLMVGMYKREREDVFEPDGYYRTGDFGYTEDGYVYFRGRLGDMIKTKGANVAPAEVEAVLNELPDVRLSFVVAMPHETQGEQVAAAVLPAAGTERVDVDKLLAHARRELSSYKVPVMVEQIADDDLQWLSTGKINKRAVRDLLIARRDAAAR
jgi:acyl-CoA synthetase (AMP-forming)/AMP-acid ligase II